MPLRRLQPRVRGTQQPSSSHPLVLLAAVTTSWAQYGRLATTLLWLNHAAAGRSDPGWRPGGGRHPPEHAFQRFSEWRPSASKGFPKPRAFTSSERGEAL